MARILCGNICFNCARCAGCERHMRARKKCKYYIQSYISKMQLGRMLGIGSKKIQKMSIDGIMAEAERQGISLNVDCENKKQTFYFLRYPPPPTQKESTAKTALSKR